jgi:hypothetical protein
MTRYDLIICVVVSDNVAGMLFCEHVSTIYECKMSEKINEW